MDSCTWALHPGLGSEMRTAKGPGAGHTCDGSHTAKTACVVDEGREDRGRIGRPIAPVWAACTLHTGWSGSTCPCRCFAVARVKKCLSDPRKERVRSQPGPRFRGTYCSDCVWWAWAPVGGAPTKEPFLARPQLKFYLQLGRWSYGIHQCRGPARSVLDRS